MKRWIVHIALAYPFLLAGQAQFDRVPLFGAARFDAAAVAADDAQREQAGELALYGRSLFLGVASPQGEWSNEGDERVCRMAVSSPGALAMELLLENVAVPAGATLRVLDGHGAELHGPVTMDLPKGTHEYSTPLVAGDHWVLEYREPAAAPVQGRFDIPWLNHAYRFVGEFAETSADREGNCHVNVACSPESDGWDGPIRSTVRISVVVSQGSGWCTGTLVNNIRQDCEPYILTAFHCGRQSTTAQFNQYKFYFNFQYANCSGGSYSTSQYLTGSQLKAYSDDYNAQYQGLGGSDFMLLLLNNNIPTAFQPYWSGWDARNLSTVSEDGVCIHHPTSAPKRISSYTQTLTTGHPMASSGLMSHYKLVWAATQNGWGITEIGSSGAGLFKQHPEQGPVLIGTCTGNSSGMSCSNHTGYAYFGKMSYHWTQNPNTADIKLKPWLDPDNTGTLILSGSANPCSVDGIEHLSGPSSLPIHPNPSHGLFHVTLPEGLQGNLLLRVLNSTGQVVARPQLQQGQYPSAEIDLNGLPDGLYTILLENNGQMLTGKVSILR